MGQGFAWFFDVAIIAIIIVCIYAGGKKGFCRTAILLLGYVIASIGGYFISMSVSPIVYDNFLQTRVESIVQNNLEEFSIRNQIKDLVEQQNIGVEIPDSEIDRIINTGGDLSEGFAEYAVQAGAAVDKAQLSEQLSSALNNNAILEKIKGKIPLSVYSQIEKYLGESKDSLSTIIKALNNPSKEESAKEVTELAVKPIVMLAVQIIILIISFTLLMILVKLIAHAFSRVNRIPIIGPVNAFFGGVLGAVQGAVIVVIIVLLVKLVITLTSNDLMVFNTPTIEETRFFKEIYNFNLFKL